MAQTIADHQYVSVNHNIVNSIFLGSELPEYNENDILVIDVTDFSVKPALNWAYDASTNTFTDPVAPQTLDEAKAAKKQAIKNARGQHLLPEYVAYHGHKFQMTLETYTNTTTAAAHAALLGDVEPGFSWIDMDNNEVPMSLDDLKGVVAQLRTTLQFAYTHAADLKKQVDVATTIDEVNAVPVW